MAAQDLRARAAFILLFYIYRLYRIFILTCKVPLNKIFDRAPPIGFVYTQQNKRKERQKIMQQIGGRRSKILFRGTLQAKMKIL